MKQKNKPKQKHPISRLLLLVWLAELLSTFALVFIETGVFQAEPTRNSQILGMLFQLAAYGLLLRATYTMLVWAPDSRLPFYSLITLFVLHLLGMLSLYLPISALFPSWLLLFGSLCFLVSNWVGLFANYVLYFTLDSHIIMTNYSSPIHLLRWCFYISTLGTLLGYLFYHYAPINNGIPPYLSTLVQLTAQLVVLDLLAFFLFSVYLRESHLL